MSNFSQNDSKFINKDTLHFYINSNEPFLTTPVKGVVLEFPGLGGSSCLGGCIDMGVYDTDFSRDFGKNGILLAYLFPGPWSWANKGAVRMANAVVSAIKDKYDLPDDAPLAVCGGSMGGLGALIYSLRSAHNITCVAAACPGVNVMTSYNCKELVPRSYFSAAAVYDMPIEDALKDFSPWEHVEEMKNIPYFICSDVDDELFPVAECDEYVEMLRKRGLSVEYYRQEHCGHGAFTPEVRQGLHKFITGKILAGRT